MHIEEKTTTKTVNTRTPAQRIGRIVLKTILFLFLFVVVLFLLLLTPPVQRFATTQVENYLEKKLKTKVEIGSISIGLPRKVVLHDIYLEDQTKDTLISGGTIKADIELFKLFSNEVKVNSLQLDNITAKVKRLLPDTTFNFQFVVDAFASQKKAEPDTAQTAVMKLAVSNIALNNFNVVYRDVLTGNDMTAYLKKASARIDTLDPYTSHFSIPSLSVDGMRVRFYQNTPLMKPETLATDMAKVGAPIPMKLAFGTVNLKNVAIDYGNTESALYSQINLGNVVLTGKDIDLQNHRIHLANLQLDNTASVIRLGKKQGAKVLVKEVKKEVIVQQQAGWNFLVDNIQVANNAIQFDNDNNPKQASGIDFAHFRGDSLNLHMRNLALTGDSIMGLIAGASFREKSGFVLDTLRGDFLYGPKQSYIKNLYVKTPGTELKRSLVAEYPSLDALTKHPEQVLMDINLDHSRVQVADILAFAPQLRTNPAFRNPSAIWRINIQGSGNMNRLYFQNLQFDGLKNTSIDASGTLAGLNDPKAAGGTFTIRRFRTSQTDMALFTGQRLSTKDIYLPETFNVTGTLSGNASRLNTNLTVASSVGNVGVNGQFVNLTNPAKLQYNASIRTNSLRIGQIMRNKVPIGNITANIRLNGTGTTPATINTKFNGIVNAVGYNNYNYRNINLNGSLKGSSFVANVDIRDPNIDLTVKASGTMAANSSFRVNGFIDSIKTLPLHLTTEPFIFHGKIDADVASLNPDYLDANVTVTQALVVSGTQRLPIDSLQFVSGHTGNEQFMRLTSDFANAALQGQYRFSDLGSIIQNNINPYFSVSKSAKTLAVKPYDFTFRLDVVNSPVLTAFVPGLNISQPIHAEGSLATGRGLNAVVNTPSLAFGTNTITGLNVNVTTTPSGLQFTGNVDHLVSGSAFNLYNTRLTATALNNILDFNLGVGDKANRTKYRLSGTLSQPSLGSYALNLRPDSLLLNYETWTVAANNQLIITPTAIGASNFVLQKGGQQLALQSTGGTGSPLGLSFTDFRLATITGFLQADSLLADGVMNGNVTFQNLMKQPLFTSDLTINDFSFRQDTIGNIALQASNTAANRYNINATVSGHGNDLQLSGSATQVPNDIALDMKLDVRQLQLSSFQGAMKDFVKSASGSVNGSVSIGGTTSKPKVLGDLNFDQAKVYTIAIGGPVTIDDEKISVTEEGFVFNEFSVKDSAGNAMNIDGVVSTTNFINYRFDLDVDARNFQALNTTKKDNSLYYGKMNITTNLHVGGTEQNPVVDGSLSVNKGTDFSIVIPQADPSIVQREGVVEFVDFSNPMADTLFKNYDTLNTTDVLGFDIAANIEISKEANFNVVVDVANGDFLNLRGEGQLTTGIDQSGKITLTGTYEIEEGAYQLSYNFLRRRFDIEKGSKITWLGEPTNAQLDVTAKYIANTAPLDLVDQQLAQSDQRNYYLQKLPFNVLLNVSGEMMKPVLTFDITLPQDKNYNVSGDVVSTVNTRLAQLRQEPSELNKQVFAILLLNRFVGENPFQSSGSGFSAASFARTSVSKLLTEQLNNLAGNLIEGVDINFDVASSDDYTTGQRRSRTDLNVGLSKRLLNDRLTVTVGSNFELEGPRQSNQSSNNIAGNVAVNYQLSKDGRYMLRFYRRNEYEGQVDGYIIETGLGFIITVDYNRFREVLHGRRIKRQIRKDNKQNSGNGQS
ncbi:MAG: hypothetical protein JWP88_1235 [Flaviaesturariibacter sp.]|nr:hypothetical protein [Flaviaesturariibacter sp.]